MEHGKFTIEFSLYFHIKKKEFNFTLDGNKK